MKTTIRRISFPLVLGLSTWFAWQASQGHGLLPMAVIPILVIPIIFALESYIPYRVEWKGWKKRHDTRVDATSAAFLAGIWRPLSDAYLPILLAYAGVFLHDLLSAGGWSSPDVFAALPTLSLFLLGFMSSELALYWAHRLQHQWPALWRFHRFHHSANRIYWLNGLRVHPGHFLINEVFRLVPLLIMGIPSPIILSIATVQGVLALFQHTNANLQHGWLNYIFATNTVHIPHHAKDLRWGNKNFGAGLIVWDILFGTFTLPQSSSTPDQRPWEQLGIDEDSTVKESYFQHLFKPLINLWPGSFCPCCCRQAG